MNEFKPFPYVIHEIFTIKEKEDCQEDDDKRKDTKERED